jgi:hypothetical protein
LPFTLPHEGAGSNLEKGWFLCMGVAGLGQGWWQMLVRTAIDEINATDGVADR